MKSVLLRLEGPLQSWGTQGRFGIRDTDREPSKSGVLGLVGAAMGMARGDVELLRQLRALSMAVRVDREGAVLRDYHTAGGGLFKGGRHAVWGTGGKTALTERFYLTDASFLAALGGEDHGLVDRVAAALRQPVWPLFLGRRACVPSAPVYAGLVSVDPASALRTVPWEACTQEPRPERLRLITETEPGAGQPRQDDPESFALYGRRHAVRFVRVEHIDSRLLPEAP